jgi:hypothetical protein
MSLARELRECIAILQTVTQIAQLGRSAIQEVHCVLQHQLVVQTLTATQTRMASAIKQILTVTEMVEMCAFLATLIRIARLVRRAAGLPEVASCLIADNNLIVGELRYATLWLSGKVELTKSK